MKFRLTRWIVHLFDTRFKCVYNQYFLFSKVCNPRSVFELSERVLFDCILILLSRCCYTSTFIQVGIPIAAGVLFPLNGTMLTPSIAGALMGLSSIGVMTNSLLLRFKFSLKQKQIHGTSPKTKTYVESDLALRNKKIKYPNQLLGVEWRHNINEVPHSWVLLRSMMRAYTFFLAGII